MDPLGALTPVIEIDRLTRWTYTDVPDYSVETEQDVGGRQTPFIFDDHINRKIILWYV